MKDGCSLRRRIESHEHATQATAVVAPSMTRTSLASVTAPARLILGSGRPSGHPSPLTAPADPVQ